MTDETNRVAETTEEIVQLLATVNEGDRLVFTYRNKQRAHVEAVMDSYLPGYDTEPAAERDLVLWFRDVERDTEGRPPYGKVYYSAPREPALKTAFVGLWVCRGAAEYRGVKVVWSARLFQEEALSCRLRVDRC